METSVSGAFLAGSRDEADAEGMRCWTTPPPLSVNLRSTNAGDWRSRVRHLTGPESGAVFKLPNQVRVGPADRPLGLIQVGDIGVGCVSYE
jgi:hypothetical protein